MTRGDDSLRGENLVQIDKRTGKTDTSTNWIQYNRETCQLLLHKGTGRTPNTKVQIGAQE